MSSCTIPSHNLNKSVPNRKIIKDKSVTYIILQQENIMHIYITENAPNVLLSALGHDSDKARKRVDRKIKKLYKEELQNKTYNSTPKFIVIFPRITEPELFGKHHAMMHFSFQSEIGRWGPTDFFGFIKVNTMLYLNK